MANIKCIDNPKRIAESIAISLENAKLTPITSAEDANLKRVTAPPSSSQHVHTGNTAWIRL